MCKRASRGGGLSWGLAEDAANGARWLSAFELPGPRLLATRLLRLDGEALADLGPVSFKGSWHAASGRLCPIIAGATLSDCAAQLAAHQSIAMSHVLCPLLIGPFAGDAALQLDTPVSIEWYGIRLTTDGHRLNIEGEHARLNDKACHALLCSIARTMPAPALSPKIRGRVGTSTWQLLSDLAERTYAPATEESRRRGAGGD